MPPKLLNAFKFSLPLASVVALIALASNSVSPDKLEDAVSHSPNRYSIAQLNLFCAQHLCAPNSTECLRTLKSWAIHVGSETRRHHYRFERNPAQFENSEPFFKMLMMAVVFAEDYGVHYDEQRKGDFASATSNDGFFADPAAVFLHGILGPERKGTCSSLPVLYVAIGRELGYPLKLVTTKGHLFVRWEGEGERFNIEATAHGLSRFDDDYYRHWPTEITPGEEAAEGYLKSLTSSEELAVFLSIRAMCLREQRRLPEAAEAFAAAARLAPGCRSYHKMAEHLKSQIGGPDTASTLNTHQLKRTEGNSL